MLCVFTVCVVHMWVEVIILQEGCMYVCHLLIINSVWPKDCLITVLIIGLFIIRYVIVIV